MTEQILAKQLRRSAIFCALGLAIQLMGFLFWSPAAFVVSASFGIPAVVLGSGWYGISVFRFMRQRGAL